MLKITSIQSKLYWEDIDANLAMLEEKIWQIDEPTDLIILPEMFNTGFSMNVEKLAEPLNYKTFKWMNQMSTQTNAAICGSYIVKESGKYYNRLYFIEPDGNFNFYNKRHLFRMGNEHVTYTAGKKRMIYTFRGWKIMPQICYDLRFPVWNRNGFNNSTDELDYDLLIFVANWPAPRTHVWNTLLSARALENQCITIGVNRIGTDGEGIAYEGHSGVYDYKGKAINKITSESAIETVSISREELQSFRQKFPVYLDWDGFDVDLS